MGGVGVYFFIEVDDARDMSSRRVLEKKEQNQAGAARKATMQHTRFDPYKKGVVVVCEG